MALRAALLVGALLAGLIPAGAQERAALAHPNILSIFDFGAQSGISYAVMELLEGETLRGRLETGPITQKQAVDYHHYYTEQQRMFSQLSVV